LDWTVKRAAGVGADLEAIYDHLLAALLDFGEPASKAHARCSARIDEIEASIDALAQAPFQGVRDDDVLPGLRHVTKDRAILYFRPDPDRQVIELLAVFHGGQDHTRRMLARMLR
jgi:plasmid stabilization system protein ParE